MRTYVSLDFKSSLSDAGLAQFTYNILSRMRGNTHFADLQTQVESEVQPAYDAYVLSLQGAADQGRSKIAEKRAARRILVEVLESLAFQLNISPSNSESLILEAGFLPRRKAQPIDAAPGQVQGLRAKAGEHSGEAILDFKRVALARLYAVEWSIDGEHWNNGVYPSVRRAVISGLPSRQDLWFRVFAIGTQQRKGAPSVPTRLFLP